MVLGKICKYYQDSTCLYKRTYCDLYCSQMIIQPYAMK